MQTLKHEYILEQIEVGRDVYRKPNGKEREVDYVVLNVASNGELFHFINTTGEFSEAIARYYFKQFMDGLAYMLK